MTPRHELKTIDPSATIDGAIEILLQHGISGAPVVNERTGEVLGMVSSSDFLLKEECGALLPMEGSAQNVEGYLTAARKIMATTVGEVMSERSALRIKYDESMRHAADMMARDRVHRLLVVDDDGSLMGILTRSDVMKDVLNAVRALPAGRDLEDAAAP